MACAQLNGTLLLFGLHQRSPPQRITCRTALLQLLFWRFMLLTGDMAASSASSLPPANTFLYNDALQVVVFLLTVPLRSELGISGRSWCPLLK